MALKNFNAEKLILDTLLNDSAPDKFLSISVGGDLKTTVLSYADWNTAFGWGDHSGLYSLIGHTHSAFDRVSSVLSGAEVFSDIIVEDGITTGIATRTLTLADLGYTGSVTANDYTHPTGDGNLHVPANSTTNAGKVLTASASAGVYTWETPSSGVTDHTLLSNIGTNTHAQIDTHIADATTHFTQGSISIPLTQGANDVTATATELNLLDLSGLTAGWVLSADSATTASWKAPTSTVSELSDLTDVNTSTPTNRNVLIADGVDWESRALVEADISDFGTYGDVFKVGTPLNKQLPVWTGDGTIKGEPKITVGEVIAGGIDLGIDGTDSGFLRLFSGTGGPAAILLYNASTEQTDTDYWRLRAGAATFDGNFFIMNSASLSALEIDAPTLGLLAPNTSISDINTLGDQALITKAYADATYSSTGTDDQVASEVPYTPYLTITSTDVQAAINELKDEVDSITVPNATSTVYGLSKLRYDTTQTTAANSATVTASRTYGIQNNASGQMVVNVPWVNTTYNIISDANLSNTGSTTAGLISGQRINTWANTRGLTTTAISDWNTAFGWGDHSSEGYTVKVGTPVNNQVAIWTGDGTLEGDPAFTYDDLNNKLNLSSSSTYAIEGFNVIKFDVNKYLIGDSDSDDLTTEINGFGGTARLSVGDGVITMTGNLTGTTSAITGSSFIKQGGTASQFLKADGTVDSNTYITSTSGVTKVGTPVDGQIGVWTGDGTIEGDAGLTFDTTNQIVTIGANASNLASLNLGNTTGTINFDTAANNFYIGDGVTGVNTRVQGRLIVNAPTDAESIVRLEVNNSNKYLIASELGALATGTANDIINYVYNGALGSWSVWTAGVNRLKVAGDGGAIFNGKSFEVRDENGDAIFKSTLVAETSNVVEIGDVTGAGNSVVLKVDQGTSKVSVGVADFVVDGGEIDVLSNGIYSNWWSNGGTVSAPNANTAFTTTGQPQTSISSVSNTTASTNYPASFGQTLLIRGASDGRDMAFWRSNSFDDANVYVGNKATGNTWNWSKLIHDGNASTELTQFLRSDAADIKTSGSLTLNDNIELFFGTSGGESRVLSNGTSTYWDLYNGDLFIRDNTTTRFTFGRTTGNLTATGSMTATNFTLSSDRKYKFNVEDLRASEIIEVTWKTFEMKSNPGQKRWGVIAQELEEKHPEFVRTGENGDKSVAYIDLLVAKISELENTVKQLKYAST